MEQEEGMDLKQREKQEYSISCARSFQIDQWTRIS